MDFIFALAMATMSSSILFGLWQLRSVERERARARSEHKRSA